MSKMPKSFGSSFFLSSILTFSYTVSLQSVMQQQCINLNSAFYSCLSSCESSSSNFWANHATCSRRWEHCWSGWRSADSTPVRLALCLGSWASGTGGNYKWCCHPAGDERIISEVKWWLGVLAVLALPVSFSVTADVRGMSTKGHLY